MLLVNGKVSLVFQIGNAIHCISSLQADAESTVDHETMAYQPS